MLRTLSTLAIAAVLLCGAAFGQTTDPEVAASATLYEAPAAPAPVEAVVEMPAVTPADAAAVEEISEPAIDVEAAAAAPVAQADTAAEAVDAVETVEPAVEPLPVVASAVESVRIGDLASARDTAAGEPLEDTGIEGTIEMLASMAVVLGLIVAAVWAFKRYAPRTASMFASENLRVVARTHVGPKQSVCLIRVPGKLLVIGATEESVNLLSEIDDPEQVERILGSAERSRPGSETAMFRSMLDTLSGDRGEKGMSADEVARSVESAASRVADLSRKLEAYERSS